MSRRRQRAARSAVRGDAAAVERRALGGARRWDRGRLVFFFPVFWTVLNSFKDEQDANTSPSCCSTRRWTATAKSPNRRRACSRSTRRR